jgi:hypothetical protein
VNFGDEKASPSVPGEAADLEVEPGFGIDWFSGESGVLAALKSKLYKQHAYLEI